MAGIPGLDPTIIMTPSGGPSGEAFETLGESRPTFQMRRLI